MGSGACALRMLNRALAGRLVTIRIIGGVSTCYLSISTSVHTLLQLLLATALATTTYPQHVTDPFFKRWNTVFLHLRIDQRCHAAGLSDDQPGF